MLNLREGAARTTTDPWANSGNGNGADGFDISFHDQDPRFYLTEQPWDEYRHQIEKRVASFDYRDDGGYQVTGGGVHPNSLYKNIASTRDWVKARLKVFSEEYESKQNGGVGVYANVSKVYRSDVEDSSATVDGFAPSRTFDDPEVAQHHNVNISNVVHLGSKFMRVNNTTDHKVKVAAYGKLYKNRGLLNHETQLRIIEDDTPWSRIEGTRQGTKNLVKLMSSQIYSDNPNIAPYTASQIGRILRQDDQLEDPGKPGMGREEMQNDNRSVMLTKDIMALMGVTENEIKFLESAKGNNKKAASKELAELYYMATTVHKLSDNEKLQLKNELILRSAGMGLTPSHGVRSAQNQIIVNPKIVEFMANKVRKQSELPDDSSVMDKIQVDPEKKLGKMDNLPIFVYKNADKTTDNVEMLWESKQTGKQKDTTSKTATYKHLYQNQVDALKTASQQIKTQAVTDANQSQTRANAGLDVNIYENLRNTMLDNNFGENKSLGRRIRPIGTKQMRRHMTSDAKPTDQMNEVSTTFS